MRSIDLVNVDSTGYRAQWTRNEDVNLDYTICLPPMPTLLTDKIIRMPESITVIKQAVHPHVLAKLGSFLSAVNNWQRSLVMDENPLSSARSSETYTFNKFGNQSVNHFVQSILEKSVSFYTDDHPHRNIAGKFDSFYAVRYKPGQEYKVHCDQGPDINRSLSVVFYVNDDYEGGELHFPNQEITLRPGAGDIVLFPSSYTHAHTSKPVIEGTKYAIVSWWT